MDNILKPVISAVVIRLIVLPFTLKTDKYFSVMRILYKTLNEDVRLHDPHFLTTLRAVSKNSLNNT